MAKIDHSRKRYAAAILLSPSLGCIVAYWIFVIGQVAFTSDGHLHNLFDSHGILPLATLILAYPTMFFAGVPFMIVAAKYNLTAFWHYTVAGVIAAWVCMMVIFTGAPPNVTDITILSAFTLGGFFCSAICWAFLFRPIKKAAD